MTAAGDTPTYDTVLVRLSEGSTTEVGSGITVVLDSSVFVLGGEYASSGEPDLVVEVHHAVDEHGADHREAVARNLAAALQADLDASEESALNALTGAVAAAVAAGARAPQMARTVLAALNRDAVPGYGRRRRGPAADEVTVKRADLRGALGQRDQRTWSTPQANLWAALDRAPR